MNDNSEYLRVELVSGVIAHDLAYVFVPATLWLGGLVVRHGLTVWFAR